MVKHLLHIIRWRNLLMIAAIQTLIYFKVMDPENTMLSWQLFVTLTLITIMLGAGGYIINDYYDVEKDKVNKPQKVIAGDLWSLSTVKKIYMTCVVIGGGFSLLLALQLDLLPYLLIYPLSVFGLWYYSFALKCKPIIGNLWVSLFCAGVICIVALPDILLQNAAHLRIELWYYVAFAFLSTWYREVVKDIEDKEGDQRAACGTFVVKYGLKAGKIMAITLGFFLLVSLMIWDSDQTNRWIKLGLNIIQGFTIASMAFILWAKNNTYYHQASNVIKLVMLLGTALLLWP